MVHYLNLASTCWWSLLSNRA